MGQRQPSVTVLTEYFYPDAASTARLLTELATGLTGQFDVSVITQRPHYLDVDRDVPVSRHERYRGVDIERVRATRFDKDVLPLRVINWLTFLSLAGIRLLRGDGRSDVVLILSTPPILPFVAWLAKRLRGTAYVYLIYDMYPDMPIGLGVLSGDGLVARGWERAMRVVYRDADRIVVLGDSMERRLTDKMADDPSFDPDKIEVIPNWEDGGFIRPLPKEENEFAGEHGTRDRFTLLYSGNIGRYHELETAIDAIGRLEERGRTDIQLVIIGEGARKGELMRRVERGGIENVRFLPFQPRDRLPETLTCGDAWLVGVVPEVKGMCVSAKLYSALAAGRPVLVVTAEGDEVARVVREADCGVHVERGDVEEAAGILARWADDPDGADRLGANARRYFEENYTRERAVCTYVELFMEMIEA